MTDEPVILPAVPDLAQQRLEFHRRAQKTVILSMIALMMMAVAIGVLCIGVFRILADLDEHMVSVRELQDAVQAETVVHNEEMQAKQDELDEAKAERDAARADLECRREAAVIAADANQQALAAAIELIIETAEQFDAVTRGQPADHDDLAGKIGTSRIALDNAANANAAYAATVTKC